MKNVLSILLSSLISTSALAGTNPLMKLKAAYPKASDYQILKRLYKTSPGAARFSDLDRADNRKSNMKCAASYSESNAVTDFDRVGKAVHVLVPAVPDRGPLFPGKPAKTRYVFMTEQMGTGGGTWDPFSELQKISENETDLSIFIEALPYGFVEEGISISISIKKNESLISFRLVKSKAGNVLADNYGYCWRE
ncbi:MAG: hypothetical protein AB7H97_18365 [Pseudobdellovibrionaceae bacterium]